jgi:hypothetical protein
VKLRSGLIWVIAGIVGVFALYSGYWLYASTVIEREFAAWIEDQEAVGYEIEHNGLTVGGYPYRFSVVADNPRIRAPQTDGGWDGRLESLRANALPYDFSHWIVQLTGPVVIESGIDAASIVHLNAERATVSLVSGHNGQTSRIGAELDGFTLETMNGPAPEIRAIETLRLSGVVEDTDVLRMRLEAVGLEIGPDLLTPGVSRTFGQTAEIARFDISVTEWTALARDGDAGAWSRAGGELQIAEAELEWGPAHVTGDGDFTLDQTARPAGRLSLKITDPEALTDALTAAGLVEESEAQLLRVGAMMAPRGPDGVSMPLSIRDGGIYWSMVRIGDLEN